ncbi:malonyl-[acyl-carrier protein] O-methyltransferase 1-like [Montipora foliosa]|uniref:malonyl-[acyl-carrier protein] O-methyltransferase 1-like n=1 Tax=Montipora foliosa TaxID=591990 RepID=UPI0035F0FD5A
METAAQGYQKESNSVQKRDGELFITGDVGPQAGDAVLDLGCGSGELSALLAKLVGPEGKVVGVDPDRERILLAQTSYSEISNLSFLEGSDSNFPGNGVETYDIIFCHLVLHWISDKQRVFFNMYKALKKGGKIALQYGDHCPQFLSHAYKILNPENEKRLSQMFVFESRSEVEKYCTSAGFVILKSCDCELQFAFENIEALSKWTWSTTHGVFDISLVTEARSQEFLALHSDKDGKPNLDFRGVKEHSTHSRLIAVKPATGLK